jgi:uncharacterized OB-fold protein
MGEPSTSEKPKPQLYPENDAFWSAASEGRLVLRHCLACNRCHHYPRALCPHCGSTELDWQPSCGRGRVYSFTVTETSKASNPVVSYVTLEEGPTVLANIIDAQIAEVEIGQAVEAAFVARENSPFPALAFKLVR